MVLLHAWAGAGKTATAAEFARWYQLTGAVQAVLFTSFEHHLTLARLLDQAGGLFGPVLEEAGVQWAALGEVQRREVAVSLLSQVPVLWVWDNIEPVAGFPAGAPSAWTAAEQEELAGFLRDLAGAGCKVVLTSRRDEQGWLGDLPARVVLPAMPMLERLELARAVASKQDGGQERFLEVQDWRPLLEFTAGNPLTITILVRQALRDRRVTRAQIEEFVASLRAGAAAVTDDTTLGRGRSLAASLDYGLAAAFTAPEHAALALLALWQGFIDIDALAAMGGPEMTSGPVPAVAGLTREQGIALLDRAAEIGLLTAHGDGYYSVHPAIPWHLHALFRQHYGPPDTPAARHALHAWTQATASLGNYWHRQYAEGHSDVIAMLEAEEANLLQARRHALHHHWHDQLIGPMQGLRALYGHTGRRPEWQRLVAEITPELIDPATGGPRPGRKQEWAFLTEYRVRIAREARDWDTAQKLQQTAITWGRQDAAEALAAPPAQLTPTQRNQIYNLAVAEEHLGQLLREQDDPACLEHYQQATTLYQHIGDRREEGVVAFNAGHAYKDIPAIRDLDQAENCYKRALELTGEHDTLGRGQTLAQLGNIAYQRFGDARRAGASEQDQLRHLNTAAAFYHQELGLIPGDAINDHAVAHGALGAIYSYTDTDLAMQHYQKAIHYYELQGDTYRAGQNRYGAAIALARAGRRHDALLYARAAHRDYQTIGPPAAHQAAQTRDLITQLEQETENNA